MIRVVLVEDESRLRQAWERLAAGQPDIQLVGSLPQADGLTAALASWETDIVVLDLSMPGMDSFEALRQVSAKFPAVKSVVYSAHNDVEMMRSAFDAGAWAFIDKLMEPSEIFKILRTVAQGQVVLPPRLAIGNP